MARTLISVRSVHDQLYDYALSSAYRSAWVYDPSFALSREADIWELVRNDAVVAAAIDRSNKSIVRPWRVDPFDGSRDMPDRRLAALVRDGLRHIDRFNTRRRRLVEARILGRTYAAILWKQVHTSLGGLAPRDWWVPYMLVDIDRRRFHWVVDWDASHRVKVGIHLEMYNTNTTQWEPVPEELRDNLIEYVYEDTEDRVGYGRGLMEAIYFYHYLKTVTFEKISQGIDRWANGIWIGRLDGLRGASTDRTNEDLRLGMEAVLQDMRSNNQAVLESIDDIKVIETSGQGHQISMDFMRYLDESIFRLLAGSVRPFGFDVGGTGARAQAETESEASEQFFQDEREDLDAVLQRDLVGAFLRVNRIGIETVGLGQARRPIFTSEQIRRQDPEQAARVMAEALRWAPVARREFYEKLELSAPLPDEDIIEPQPQVGPGGLAGMIHTRPGGPRVGE